MGDTPKLSSVDVLLDRAKQRSATAIQLGLDRVSFLLAQLGNPQQSLDVIHIAGSNGKGSVVAFLESILRVDGFRVGTYTSPHLHRFNERIQVDGKSITDAELQPLLERVLEANGSREATFFELTTAVALCHFKDQGLGDQRVGEGRGVVLLETGLGGRLDATNVVQPKLSIITSITVDHTDYLGNTLSEIAEEKAGIIKSSIPTVAAGGTDEVVCCLTRHAEKMDAPLFLLGRDFKIEIESKGDNWSFRDKKGTVTLPKPGLNGHHQFENASLAIAGIRQLQTVEWPIKPSSIPTGIRKTRWPGRLEWFPGKPPVLLDGAHNVEGCQSLALFLHRIFSFDGLSSLEPASNRLSSSCFLVFSAMKNKDIKGMAQALAPYVKKVWTTQVEAERGESVEKLTDIWRKLKKPVEMCATPNQAFYAAQSACPTSSQVVVAGSLYLVGAIRSELLKNVY